MDASWVQSLHNLHCPSCETRLVQRARRFLIGRRPVYVGDVGTLACPSGHALPDREALYAYRAEQGHPPTAPVAELDPPRHRTGAAQASRRPLPVWSSSTRHSPVR